MTQEIERKFIVDRLPPADVLGTGSRLRQGYLAEENGIEVRIRLTERAATLAVKCGGGLVRTEVEVAISAADAEQLWPYTAGRRVDKQRYRVGLGDHTAEVDVYSGELDGLSIVEVEFGSGEAADAFRPPDWFGRELTGLAEWSNAALARHGHPD